jgi:hypothetical protein
MHMQEERLAPLHPNVTAWLDVTMQQLAGNFKGSISIHGKSKVATRPQIQWLS